MPCSNKLDFSNFLGNRYNYPSFNITVYNVTFYFLVIENNISGKVEFHRSHAEDLKDEEELFTGAKVSKMKLTEKTREESEEAANQF